MRWGYCASARRARVFFHPGVLPGVARTRGRTLPVRAGRRRRGEGSRQLERECPASADDERPRSSRVPELRARRRVRRGADRRSSAAPVRRARLGPATSWQDPAGPGRAAPLPLRRGLGRSPRALRLRRPALAPRPARPLRARRAPRVRGAAGHHSRPRQHRRTRRGCAADQLAGAAGRYPAGSTSFHPGISWTHCRRRKAWPAP